MASFSSASLSILHLHDKPSILVSSTNLRRIAISDKALPYPRKPLRFSTKTLAADRFIPPLPRLSCSLIPPNTPPLRKSPTFLRRIAEGAAIVLFGSLLFLGRFGARPAFALDDPTNVSAPLVEEKVTASEEDEVDMYAKVLEKNPNDVEALKVVVYGRLKKGKTKEAVDCVERLIQVEPDEVEWKLLQALCYELMGKLDKAKRLFKDILKERPLLIRALHGLALTMHKSRESAAAFKMLNKALELAQREGRVIEERNIKILIAQMHVIKGDLEGASRRFQDLINEDPRDFRPYLCQGIIYSLLDKQEQAEEQFETYRSLVPDEFPQRNFIDDVIISAKTETQQLAQELESEYSSQQK